MVRNIADNFNRLSRVHERFIRQTTDGRRSLKIDMTSMASVAVCDKPPSLPQT